MWETLTRRSHPILRNCVHPVCLAQAILRDEPCSCSLQHNPQFQSSQARGQSTFSKRPVLPATRSIPFIYPSRPLSSPAWLLDLLPSSIFPLCFGIGHCHSLSHHQLKTFIVLFSTIHNTTFINNTNNRRPSFRSSGLIQHTHYLNDSTTVFPFLIFARKTPRVPPDIKHHSEASWRNLHTDFSTAID